MFTRKTIRRLLPEEPRSIIVRPFLNHGPIFIISDTKILNSKERSKGFGSNRALVNRLRGRDGFDGPTQTLGPATILVKETNKITNFFKPTYFRDGMRVAT